MTARTMTLFSSAMIAMAIPRMGEAQTGDFVHSANGPGTSRTTVNIGVRTYAPSLADVDIILPTVDFNLVHGINRAIDYELRVSTIGLLSLIDTGVKFRIAGDHDIAFGARLDATGLLLVTPREDATEVTGLFGVTPGLILSTGGSRVQISAGLDVPIVLGSASDVAGVHATGPDSPFGYLLRPWLGVEVPISHSASLSLQAQAYISTIGETAVAPNLAAGISW